MEQNNNNNNNEEILDILQLYLDELEYVKELGEIEEAVILDEYVKEVEDKQKREKLKKMLIESNLRYAMSFATNYLGKGIDVVDIIAEINLSLTSTINSFTGGNLKEKIETDIKNSLEALLIEEDSIKVSDKRLLDRLEQLTESSRELAIELGREASVAELAKKMEISEDEVSGLIKMIFDKGEKL